MDGTPKNGTCCACGYSGHEVGPCSCRDDGSHCEHWWDGEDDFTHIADTRQEKIARAAYDIGVEELSLEWDQVLDARLKKDWVVATQAAVRAAYEIDGVRELVEAAEMAVGADMALNVKANPFNDEVLAASARVREAMGGQT